MKQMRHGLYSPTLVTQCTTGAAANAFVADAHGNLFVVGCLQPYGASGAQDQWLVRETPAGTC
jgi:hypothetical protein